jgi:two-component system, cell cycle response regulator DivK
MGNSVEQKPKLLIAEDDFENQKFLNLFLKKYFLVDICDSSDSFYKLIANNKYDIILMDISLRGNKNGLELTKEIKSNPDTSTIPIICYTAHAFHSDRLNALDAGCDAYISKPSDIYTLLNSLFSFLSRKNSTASEPGSATGFALA